MRFGLPGSVVVHAVLIAAVMMPWAAREVPLPAATESISVDIIGFERDMRPDPTPMAPPDTSPEPVPPEPVEDAEPVPSPQPPKTPPPPQKQQQPPRKSQSLEDVRGQIDRTTPEQGRRITPQGQGSQLIASEADGIKRKLESCWREWSDIPNPESIVVVVRARFTPAGMIEGRPEVLTDMSRLPPGGFSRVAIDRSINAFLACQPFRMAPGRTTTATQVFRFSPQSIDTVANNR